MTTRLTRYFRSKVHAHNFAKRVRRAEGYLTSKIQKSRSGRTWRVTTADYEPRTYRFHRRR